MNLSPLESRHLTHAAPLWLVRETHCARGTFKWLSCFFAPKKQQRQRIALTMKNGTLLLCPSSSVTSPSYYIQHLTFNLISPQRDKVFVAREKKERESETRSQDDYYSPTAVDSASLINSPKLLITWRGRLLAWDIVGLNSPGKGALGGESLWDEFQSLTRTMRNLLREEISFNFFRCFRVVEVHVEEWFRLSSWSWWCHGQVRRGGGGEEHKTLWKGLRVFRLHAKIYFILETKRGACFWIRKKSNYGETIW